MKPFAHQEKEFSNHWFTRSRALLWQMRTGKTKTAIDIACALYQICEIDAVIVIAPNGVHRNWTLNQLPQHHWPIPWHCYAWRASDKNRSRIVKDLTAVEGLVWLTFNMESLILEETQKAIRKFIRHRSFMLVVDESHHFGSPGSKRTFAIRHLSKHAAYTRILSGTPIEDSPQQAYSQFEILEKGALGYTRYTDFQDRYVKFKRHRSGKYDMVDEYINLDELRSRIARYASVVLREDCEDLPPIQIDVRVTEMTDLQMHWFRAFKKQDMTALRTLGFQEPPTGGAVFTKLQQIEGGFIKTPKGIKSLDDDKFNIVLDELTGYPAIVFCQYIHEIEALTQFLGDRAAAVHGKIRDRDGIIRRFNDDGIDWIVAEPHCISEGYNLSRAEKTLWYSQTHTARIRAQGNERSIIAGGTSKQIVDLVWPKGVNEYFLSLTKNKTSVADDVARRGLKAILDGLGE